MDLQLELSQKQIITQKVIQSMEVLQLNALELTGYLETLHLENPVMEIESDEGGEFDKEKIDMERKLEWLSTTDRQNRVYYSDDYSGSDAYDKAANPAASEETLYDYLHAQLILDKTSKKERAILEYVLNCLDEKGYFKEDIEAIAKEFRTDSKTVQSQVERVKRLDPAGVGAKDLSECLLLQLERTKKTTPLIETVIRNHLEDIGKQHHEKIARVLRVDVKDVQSCCKTIKGLDPKPGAHFSCRNRLRYITPDAVVIKLEDEFQILINEYSYPKIKVSTYYENLYRTTDDAETKKYLKEKLQKVIEMQENLKLRSHTLSRVVHELVLRQERFFMKGPGFKKPLKLSDIAQALSLHESTISRAMSNKYLQCSWGVYPLNYFLTSVATVHGQSGAKMTQEEVYKKLQEIIDAEDKAKPLSDEKLAQKLKDRNIHISRRTVNKYRGILGIPDKSGRKVV